MFLNELSLVGLIEPFAAGSTGVKGGPLICRGDHTAHSFLQLDGQVISDSVMDFLDADWCSKAKAGKLPRVKRSHTAL